MVSLLAAAVILQDQEVHAGEVALMMAAPLGAFTYDLKIAFEVEGEEVAYSARQERTLMEASPAGWTLSLLDKEPKIATGGKTLDLTPGGAKVFRFGRDGVPLAPSEGRFDETDLRFMRQTSFFWPSKPVKIGEPWEVSLPAVPEAQLPAASASCRLVNKDKTLGRASFQASCQMGVQGSQPESVSTFWLEASTGLVLKAEANLPNAALAGRTTKARWSIILRQAVTGKAPTQPGQPKGGKTPPKG